MSDTAPVHASRILFVGGLHRSGTSVLARLVAAHPEASGFVNTGVEEDEGQFVQTVFLADDVLGGVGRMGFHPAAHMTESHRLAAPEPAALLLDQWSRYWNLEKSLLVEKTPSHVLRTRYLQAVAPGARIAVVLRHPVACALAQQKWSKRPLYALLRHWFHCHRILWQDLPRTGGLRLVHYEMLIRDPQAVVEALWRWCGLEPEGMRIQETLDPHVNDRYFDAWSARQRAPGRRLYYRGLEEMWEREAERWGYSMRRPRDFRPARLAARLAPGQLITKE